MDEGVSWRGLASFGGASLCACAWLTFALLVVAPAFTTPLERLAASGLAGYTAAFLVVVAVMLVAPIVVWWWSADILSRMLRDR